MKKIKILAAGIMMFLAVVCMPQKAYAAENIGVIQVSDITDVSSVGVSKVFQVGNGMYSNTAQFTLKKQAYVYVGVYSTVCSQGYTNLGIMNNFSIYSDPSCSNLVYNGRNTEISAKEKITKYLLLDAGTYYIHFAKEPTDSYIKESNGEFKISIAAQYLNTTAVKNGSRARAKAISTDKNVSGLLSNATRISWYKFNVASDTAVNISASLENDIGEKHFPSSMTGVTLYRSNNRIYNRFNISDNYYQTAYSNTVTLPAGTYYLAVSGNSSYGAYSWNNTKLIANKYENMGILRLKVTTVKKTSIQSLKNVKGKKAQAAYKAVSGAKGYQIQYSTDKKFKKGVKNINAKSTKATISKLSKGKRYYVRVRAFKYNENGQKLYGAWSAAKNVLISK